MAIKNFSKGIKSTIGNIRENENKLAEEKLKNDHDAKEKMLWLTTDAESTSKKGLKFDQIRMTIITNEILLNKIKAIAYWDRLHVKDLIDEAFEDFVKKYEEKNKILNPIPKK